MTSSEQDLVRRCQESTGAAFEEAYEGLYGLYKNRVFAICLRIVGNEEDALDVAQEALVTVARRIGSFEHRSQFSSWVYRIAVNAAIDSRRRRMAGPAFVSADPGSQPGSRGTDPAAPLESSEPSIRAATTESCEAVRLALTRLNPRVSALLTLRYVQGLSYEAISEIQECSLGTVKSRLNRAHQALREYLERHGQAGLPTD